MKKDADWKEFFSDDERYSDIINGLACQGKQIVSKDDLSEMDTQTGFYKARKLFLKASRKWDGPISLHEMLDFTDLPEGVRKFIPDYQINLIEIRKFENTEVFKTDVKQVFDFIRCAEDKQALRRLVVEDEYYQNMEEDAFDVVANYTNSLELVEVKKILKEKDGKVNMCKGLRDWIEEERQEGKEEGREEGVVALVRTCKSFEGTKEITMQKLQEQFGFSEEIAAEKVEMYWN